MERLRVRRWVWAACLAVALCLPAGAMAELPELSAPRTGRNAPKDAAVVIAVENYVDLPKVEFANRDADAFVDYLRHTVGVSKDRIRELRDKLVTPRAMERALEEAARLAQPGGTLWIYFSGHGAPAEKDAYLIGAGALAQPDYVDESSLRRSRLLELAESTRATRSVVLLDACYTGLSWRFAVPGALVAVPKVAVWTATRAGQVATPLARARHGLFSYYAIRALTGAGDADGDGTVTLEEATTWVERAIRDEQSGTGGSQTPEAVVPKGAWGWAMAEGLGRREPTRLVEPAREVAVTQPPAPPVVVVPEPVTPPRAEVPRGYVRIEPGRFTMGSPASEAGRDENETQHEVVLTRAFLLKVTEVTQGEWKALMGGNPSYFSKCGDSCPVERVSWWEAVQYLNALSRSEGLEECYELGGCTGTLGGGCPASEDNGIYCTGDYTCGSVKFRGAGCRGYRLPTESEWEYAARAGTGTGTYAGELRIVGTNNGPALDAIAWYGGNSAAGYAGAVDCSGREQKQYPLTKCGPQPVGGKKPNALGLYDMLGNVFEWTGDWYGDYPGGRLTDPEGAMSGANRVIRGGSWFALARDVRAADRGGHDPAGRSNDVGFRAARSIP